MRTQYNKRWNFGLKAMALCSLQHVTKTQAIAHAIRACASDKNPIAISMASALDDAGVLHVSLLSRAQLEQIADHSFQPLPQWSERIACSAQLDISMTLEFLKNIKAQARRALVDGRGKGSEEHEVASGGTSTRSAAVGTGDQPDKDSLVAEELYPKGALRNQKCQQFDFVSSTIRSPYLLSRPWCTAAISLLFITLFGGMVVYVVVASMRKKRYGMPQASADQTTKTPSSVDTCVPCQGSPIF